MKTIRHMCFVKLEMCADRTELEAVLYMNLSSLGLEEILFFFVFKKNMAVLDDEYIFPSQSKKQFYALFNAQGSVRFEIIGIS